MMPSCHGVRAAFSCVVGSDLVPWAIGHVLFVADLENGSRVSEGFKPVNGILTDLPWPTCRLSRKALFGTRNFIFDWRAYNLNQPAGITVYPGKRTMKAARLHGFKDIFHPETEKLRLVESKTKEVFERFGFSEIIIPILEPSGVYSTGLGDTTDIVQKEMYTFETKGGEWVSMRPEGTAGVVRAFIEHSLYRKSPVTKLYYTGEMFRHEKPQEGRQRSFNQIGAELFGSKDPLADSEIIAMLWLAITELGLSDHVELELNSIGKPAERERYKKALTRLSFPEERLSLRELQKQTRYEPSSHT